MAAIQNFTDLEAWRRAHRFSLAVYEVSRKLPREEQYGLTRQVRRCAISVSSNIAEGFSRQTVKEKIQFYTISFGSLSELQSQLLFVRDARLADGAEIESLLQQLADTRRLLAGLIKYLRP